MAAPSLEWQSHVSRTLGFPDGLRWISHDRGAWTTTWRAEMPTGRRCFVKASEGRHRAMIDAEADGLRALAATRTVRVPAVIAADEHDGVAYLVLEWLDFGTSRAGAAGLGRALAALHRALPPRGPNGERFGWRRHNWIGGAPQSNGWLDDWPAFFRDARLAPQLALVTRNGCGRALSDEGDRLLAALPSLLRGHAPAPSLLHGDLWSGNAATLEDGTPVTFDPAVYVGDRETDLAMTELFGGFSETFHAAYREAWPLPDGYPQRRTLYNLYHVLNHLNLFGDGYSAQAVRMIDELLAHARR
jgi:fructosamine-3-kinase